MSDKQESRPPSAVAGPGPSSVANKRALSTVTTTVVSQDGIDSARVGACSNCRSRKIKCSGDRPTCKTCAKNNQQCDYPLHVSRKRKDRESSSKRQPEAVGAEYVRGSVSDGVDHARTDSYGPASLPSQGSYPNLHVNTSYPTLNFGIDPLTLQTQTDPAGVHFDNAWLENFLAYDFNNDFSAVAASQGMGLSQEGMDEQRKPDHESYARQTVYNPPSNPLSGSGDGSSRTKSKAKFKVPYFR